MTFEILEGMYKLVDVHGKVIDSIHRAGRCSLPGIGWPARISVQQSGSGTGVITVTGTAHQLKAIQAAVVDALESDSEESGVESGEEEGESGEPCSGGDDPEDFDAVSICQDGPDEDDMVDDCYGYRYKCDCGSICSRCYEDKYI